MGSPTIGAGAQAKLFQCRPRTALSQEEILLPCHFRCICTSSLGSVLERLQAAVGKGYWPRQKWPWAAYHVAVVGSCHVARQVWWAWLWPVGRGAQANLPERCQPKLIVLVAGRVETQREKRLTPMLPMSVSRWAASVMIARLCAKYPPARQAERPQGCGQRLGLRGGLQSI